MLELFYLASAGFKSKRSILMGYDPTDYFWFWNYNQNGTIETRFGLNTELESLISKVHTENMQVYADMAKPQ
jgi:hypothetical protein